MPELPEVETIRSGLEPLLVGRTITGVICHRPDLRYPLPDMAGLIGEKMTSIRRRSKYLLFDLADCEQTLVWHLGMTGQFHVLPHQSMAGAHEHVRFDFSDGQSLRYRDARRFGYAGLLARAYPKSILHSVYSSPQEKNNNQMAFQNRVCFGLTLFC